MSDVDREDLECPITGMLFNDPVQTVDGFTYERHAIEQWFITHNTSPMTGMELADKSLTFNDIKKVTVNSIVSFNPICEQERFEPFDINKLANYANIKTDEDKGIRMLECLITIRRRIAFADLLIQHRPVIFTNTLITLFLLNNRDQLMIDPELIIESIWTYSNLCVISKIVEGCNDDFVHNVLVSGRYPIHHAIIRNSFDILSYLFTKKISIEVRDIHQNTPIALAIMNNSTDQIVKGLLEYGAFTNVCNARGDYLMHLAVKLRHQNHIKLLIQYKAPIDPLDAQGDTPLHTAIRVNAPLDTIKVLLTAGGSQKIKDKKGDYPIHRAIRCRASVDVISTLCTFVQSDSGIDLRNTTQETPLHIAVRYGAEPNIINMLISHTTSLACKDLSGDFPIHIAVAYSSVAIVEILIRRGACINLKNSKGDTPLITSLRSSSIHKFDIIKFLVEYGADLEAVDLKRRRPIHVALLHNNPDNIISYLLHKNLSLETVDIWGWRVIHYATYFSSCDVVKMIVEKGVEIDAKTLDNTAGKGFTSVSLACYRRDIPILNILLSKGADIRNVADISYSVQIVASK